VVLDKHWLENWTALVPMCLLVVFAQAVMVPGTCFYLALKGTTPVHILKYYGSFIFVAYL